MKSRGFVYLCTDKGEMGKKCISLNSGTIATFLREAFSNTYSHAPLFSPNNKPIVENVKLSM